MSTIYWREDRKRYYFKVKSASGKWLTFQGDRSREVTARQLRELERHHRPERHRPAREPEPAVQTLQQAAEAWLKRRSYLRNVENERGQLVNHVFPMLGERLVTEIHRRDVRDLVAELRGKVAPKTVRNIYGTLHKLFADLLTDDVVDRTPCVLGRGDLPANRPKDPDFRQKCIFTRGEVEKILTAPSLLEDRRVLYRLLFLTGTRLSEATELRWRDLDEDAADLMRLTVARSGDGPTKTGTVRQVPIVPLLAETLKQWKRHGFVRLMKRLPQADDPIVPNRQGTRRNRHTVREQFLIDLKSLGLRPRRVHDTRRSFVSMCLEDGAVRDVLRRITHSGNLDVLDLYTTISWTALCTEMRKLRVRGALATVHALPVAATATAAAAPEFGPTFGPGLGPEADDHDEPRSNDAESNDFVNHYLVTPPGVEDCLRGEERVAQGVSGRESASDALPMTPADGATSAIWSRADRGDGAGARLAVVRREPEPATAAQAIVEAATPAVAASRGACAPDSAVAPTSPMTAPVVARTPDDAAAMPAHPAPADAPAVRVAKRRIGFLLS